MVLDEGLALRVLHKVLTTSYEQAALLQCGHSRDNQDSGQTIQSFYRGTLLE